MHTTVLNTFNTAMGSLTALSKDIIAAQTSFFQSATALAGKGYSKATPEAMIDLATQASTQSMTAGLKAARAALVQGAKATKDLASGSASAPAVPGMAALQTAHTKAAAAMSAALDQVESFLPGRTRAARA